MKTSSFPTFPIAFATLAEDLDDRPFSRPSREMTWLAVAPRADERDEDEEQEPAAA